MNQNDAKPRGPATPDSDKSKAHPVPDKDWYRKWQQRLDQKEKGLR